MRTYIIVGSCVLLIIVGAVIYGIVHFASIQPEFWKNFVPGMLANIVGVSIGAIIGVPIGLAINHYVTHFHEQRHHRRQVVEVRQLLEQVRIELTVHQPRLNEISATFRTGQLAPPSPTTSLPTTRIDSPLSAPDVVPMMLSDMSGKQLIGNRSILEIGEMQILFHVSSYYTRVDDLNRLFAWRAQDQLRPENWDGKIHDLAYTLTSGRAQLDYDIQQALTRLNTN